MTGSRARTDQPTLVSRFNSRLSALAFWSAIVLPVFYLALLVTRITTKSELLLFVGLIGLHVVTLVVGHTFRPGNQR